jgi:hypothetical protein
MRPTALKISSPWSGDENDPIPHTYRAWYVLYRSTRQIRHWFGLHDSELTRIEDASWLYCTWCGKRGDE